MNNNIKSIRTFIGAKDYALSCAFYKDFGFEVVEISKGMCYFKKGDFGFYLQDYYAKEWIDNSMLFIETENLDAYHKTIKALELDKKYKNVRVSGIKIKDWGNEFFVHDPSGILWHIGNFNK